MDKFAMKEKLRFFLRKEINYQVRTYDSWLLFFFALQSVQGIQDTYRLISI